MIIDKVPFPNDPTPTEAPPSYDTLSPLDPALLQDAKRNTSAQQVASTSLLRPPQLRPSGSSSPTLKSLPPIPSTSTSNTNGKAKSPAHWFNFAAQRTTRDVRSTVLGLVRDLVREHNPHCAAPAGILQSCADACRAHALSLSSILQERSIEGRTPLYWAIVKRRPDDELDEDTRIPDLLSALLAHAAPLTPATVAEVRHACLATSDQHLFQRLRMSPEFSSVSGADQMLLGVTQPQDEIEVEDVPGDDGSFAVNFVIPHFQKRMMVTQEIALEFIARSRMWKLSFYVAKPNQYSRVRAGSWCIILALQDNSPPTWVDSRLVVADPIEAQPPTPLPTSPEQDSEPPSLIRSASSTFGFVIPSPKPTLPKPKPPIVIRVNSIMQLEAPGQFIGGHQIIEPLENTPMGPSLQYAGSSYIAADEKLRARFEARLQKPETECTIC